MSNQERINQLSDEVAELEKWLDDHPDAEATDRIQVHMSAIDKIIKMSKIENDK